LGTTIVSLISDFTPHHIFDLWLLPLTAVTGFIWKHQFNWQLHYGSNFQPSTPTTFFPVSIGYSKSILSNVQYFFWQSSWWFSLVCRES
jgi:hypothetical protein